MKGIQPETRDRMAVIRDQIAAYIEQNGYPPSLRDIMQMAGISSTSVVSHYLRQMKALGWIDFAEGKSRTITVRGISILPKAAAEAEAQLKRRKQKAEKRKRRVVHQRQIVDTLDRREQIRASIRAQIAPLNGKVSR